MAGGNRNGGKRSPSKTKRDNPAQSERFIKAAKELEADDPEAFERAIGTILKPKKKPATRSN